MKFVAHLVNDLFWDPEGRAKLYYLAGWLVGMAMGAAAPLVDDPALRWIPSVFFLLAAALVTRKIYRHF